MRVCVVGAGISGTACARVLQESGHEVVVLDRGRSPGGRMSGRTLAGRHVDLGASYFTVSDDGFAEVVRDWELRGLARPWTEAFHVLPGGERKTGPLRWGAGAGLRGLVVDLAVGLDVRSGTEVVRVAPGPEVDGDRYDAVVLAMPDPQALRLLDDALAAERAALSGRAWEAVLALAAVQARRTWDLDGAFVHDDDVLGWIADDGSRRGDGAPVLVAHSTPALAAQHLRDPSGAVPRMTAALRRLLDVPEPEQVHVHRWTFAKPVAARQEPFFLGDARVGMCGDGWGAAKVETAWRSGTLLGEALATG